MWYLSLEPLINRCVRKYLPGTVPLTYLVKQKGLGTIQFEITITTDYNKYFCILHEVRGVTKDLWRTLRNCNKGTHKCEWTEHISSMYAEPDIMAICLELYLKYHYPMEKLLTEATSPLSAQCIIYIGSKPQETEQLEIHLLKKL